LETALWCAQRADASAPKTCPRTEALRPYAFSDSRHEAVDSVLWERHLALALPRVSSSAEAMVDVSVAGLAHAVEVVRAGRFLAWERDQTIDDGTGEYVTRGTST